MMKIRVTLVQEVEVETDENTTLDDVTDSFTDTLLDEQDVLQETSDGKFTFSTGPFTLKVEEVE